MIGKAKKKAAHSGWRRKKVNYIDKETVKKIAGIVSDLKYYEWLKVVHAIEKNIPPHLTS